MDEQERRRMLVAALEQLPMTIVVTVGPEVRLVGLSDAGREQLGDPRLDTPMSEWTDAVGRHVHEHYEQVFRTGEAFVGTEWAVELAEGSAPAQWANHVVVPLKATDGRVIGAVGVEVDLSDLVRARQHGGSRHSEIEQSVLEASEVLLELQDAVLPKGLPVPQGVEIAARYLLAEDYAGAGGDWFDAVPLPDGRLAVVVGDVVGHGVEASVVMGELKVLFEERVRQDGDVVAALELLDHRARRTRAARTTTICAAVVDPGSGLVTYCTAGHPPPVVVSGAGDAAYLPATGTGPIGTRSRFTTAEHVLSDGDLLLLYSDGLVERPGRTPAQNTVELLQVVGGAVRGTGVRGTGPASAVSEQLSEQLVERVCRHTLDLLTRTSGYADDITVLALQVVPPVPPLELRLSAVAGSVGAVRSSLGDWLTRLRVSDLDRTAIQHAVGELVANVVQHAYPSPGGERPVSVGARLTTDGVVELEVADRGTWRQVRPGTGGRGLAMASGFLDELDLEHDGGTRARGRHRVSHPASLLRGTATGPTPQHLEPRPFALGVHDDVVHLSGALDVAAADDLRAALRRSSRGGIRAITVDLSEVDLLCSTAVQVLFDARASDRLALVAPMGSPAQHVLELVRLPYRTSA